MGIKSSNENIKMVARKIDNGVSAKVDIVAKLKKRNLTCEEQMKVGIKLMDKPKYIHLFWGLRENKVGCC